MASPSYADPHFPVLFNLTKYMMHSNQPHTQAEKMVSLTFDDFKGMGFPDCEIKRVVFDMLIRQANVYLMQVKDLQVLQPMLSRYICLLRPLFTQMIPLLSLI